MMEEILPRGAARSSRWTSSNKSLRNGHAWILRIVSGVPAFFGVFGVRVTLIR